jgi:ribosomal protein L29
MKRNDIKALHDKTIVELEQQLGELEKNLAKAKLELPTGKLEDMRLPSKLRDDIARVKTVMHEKRLITKTSKENKENK